MPRRNHRGHERPGSLPGPWKPTGRKRPRAWHRGPAQDMRFLEAERRLQAREAEAT
jgi:hypothetical protein